MSTFTSLNVNNHTCLQTFKFHTSFKILLLSKEPKIFCSSKNFFRLRGNFSTRISSFTLPLTVYGKKPGIRNQFRKGLGLRRESEGVKKRGSVFFLEPPFTAAVLNKSHFLHRYLIFLWCLKAKTTFSIAETR